MEDSHMFADILETVCIREMKAIVVAKERTGRGALREFLKEPPDIIFADVGLPDMCGLELVRLVNEALPNTFIAVVTVSFDADTLDQIAHLRVHAYFNKQLDQFTELLHFARQYAQERPSLANCCTNPVTKRRDMTPPQYRSVLSPYELQVLSLIGQGYTDAEIGQRIGISPSTVQSRRRDIMIKVNVHSTPKLIRLAIETGLTRLR